MPSPTPHACACVRVTPVLHCVRVTPVLYLIRTRSAFSLSGCESRTFLRHDGQNRPMSEDCPHAVLNAFGASGAPAGGLPTTRGFVSLSCVRDDIFRILPPRCAATLRFCCHAREMTWRGRAPASCQSLHETGGCGRSGQPARVFGGFLRIIGRYGRRLQECIIQMNV